MKKNYLVHLLFAVLILSVSTSYSQEYGKLFSKSEADKLFGPVLHSVAIPAKTLQNLTLECSKYIMFKVSDNVATILDNSRKPLFPNDTKVDESDVYTVFSVSVINTLLSKGTSSSVFVEQRKEVLSITYDEDTVEVGVKCPPFCP